MTMTEIYGTLGPACQSETTLTAMFRAGMTGMRLNLSHTSLADSRDLIENYRKAADACGVSPELLIDLQGPELRLGEMEPIAADPGQNLELPLAARILDALEPGDRVLIDDGRIEASVVSVGDQRAALHVLRGGVIKSRKSLKIEGKDVAGPSPDGARQG
jgi:pyruvate kinase